jgi:hypothetical protein
MKMVFHAVQPEQMAIVIVDNPPDVTEQILSTRYVQDTFAVLRRENYVMDDLCVGGQNVLRVVFDPFRVVVLIIVNRRLHLRLPMF